MSSGLGVALAMLIAAWVVILLLAVLSWIWRRIIDV